MAELTTCWDLSCVDGIYRLSFLSTLTAATSYIFVPSVVLTHALGLVAHLPKSAKAHHILRGPWEGGEFRTRLALREAPNNELLYLYCRSFRVWAQEGTTSSSRWSPG